MTEIIPAIIPASYADIERAAAIFSGVAPMIQIDITDGVFAGTRSWPFTESGAIDRLPNDLHYEIDLMVDDPLPLAISSSRLGAKRIVVHIESLPDVLSFINAFRAACPATELAFALDIGTSNDVLIPYAEFIDAVEFMGIAHIGRQGEPFDSRVIPKIEEFHMQFSYIPIGVDGGVTANVLDILKSAGATRFVVGSAIFGDQNPVAAYHALRAL